MEDTKLVGIVVVAHSRKLAAELISFASTMKFHDFPFVNAAGPDETSDAYGTNALLIKDAVLQADKGKGVLVFVDIGSAIMSVQAALQLLPEGVMAELVDCPLVEGVVAAVAANYPGASFEQVKSAALEARSYQKL